MVQLTKFFSGGKSMDKNFLWDVGISSCLTGNFDDNFLIQLFDADIHYVEISGGRNSFFESMDFTHNAEKIFKNALKYGVTINSIHLPFTPSNEIDLTLSGGDIYEYSMNTYKELIKASANAGIKIAVIHPSYGLRPEQNRTELLNNACANLNTLCEVAKQGGMQIAVENLPRTCLGNTKEEILDFITQVPDLMVCFDTNHSLIQPNKDFIKALGNRIIALHISDYDFVDECHWLPMQGKNDWKTIIDELKNAQYKGVFTYEVPSNNTITAMDIKNNYIGLMNLYL